ncbi:MAG TPA: AsmA-like C-terminal region-containing protein [Candidatus Eisenbacteria bacterium]|nr:AsmA-like C-terminal region-containing protein [Candidatus Eisenbacteria bacterium]
MDSERWARSRGRAVLWVLLVLVLLPLLAWGAVALLMPSDKVRALVTRKLATVVTRDVRYADVGVSLWPPVRLTVRRPALAEMTGWDAGPALEAQSLHLDLDLFKLLSRRMVVRRLVIDRPEIHLVMRADGTTNLDSILVADSDRRPSDMSLAIRELVISHGRVLLDDLGARRRMVFNVDSRVGLTSEAGGQRFATAGETVLSGLAFGATTAARVSDLDHSLDALEWRVAHDGKYDGKQKRLALAKLGLRMGRAEIAMAGTIDDPGAKARLDLRARGANVDLGDVLDFVSAADARAVHGLVGDGRLDFDLHIGGSAGPALASNIAGVVKIANGSFRYPGAPASIDALTMSAKLAPDSITIGDLRARVAGQPLRGALFATRFADPWVRFAVQGNVDLASVAPLVAPSDTKLGGRAAVDLRGSGYARDPGALALSGTAKLADVTVQSPVMPNRIEAIRGDIAFSPERASITGFSARAGRSSIALEGTAQRPLALLTGPGRAGEADPSKRVAPAVVNFNAASSYLDLAEILPLENTGVPVLPHAVGTGHVTIARLKNRKLDVSDVNARVALEPGVMVVPQFALRGYDGNVSGSARFDLRAPARPEFAVKSRVDSLSADAILSAWTPLRGLIQGSLNSSLDLSGAGLDPNEIKRTVSAIGAAQILNGTLGPAPALEAVARYVRIPGLSKLKFRDSKVPFRVQNGRVITDGVSLDGPNGEWRMVGSVGFDGTLDYALSITLPPEAVQALGARSAIAAGALADAQGRLLLDLHVSGRATAPQVAWDGQSMQDRLAGKVSQAIEQQRARIEDQARAAADSTMSAAQDSARAAFERAQRAAADSLRARAGGILKEFFTTRRDTTQRP